MAQIKDQTEMDSSAVRFQRGDKICISNIKHSYFAKFGTVTAILSDAYEVHLESGEYLALLAKDMKLVNIVRAKKDMINPDHYKIGGIETIDFMQAKSTKEEFTGHLRLTAIKYLSRAGHKDETIQEYKKAVWYINKLIEVLSKEQE